MKYGVSYNCSGNYFDIGGGGEGDTTLDYVSDDLNKLIDRLTGEECGNVYTAKTEHKYVGEYVDIGRGPIVAVIGEDEDPDDDDLFYVVCVVFEDPVVPVLVS